MADDSVGKHMEKLRTAHTLCTIAIDAGSSKGVRRSAVRSMARAIKANATRLADVGMTQLRAIAPNIRSSLISDQYKH